MQALGAQAGSSAPATTSITGPMVETYFADAGFEVVRIEK